jgi:glutamine synthetase
MNPYLGIAAMLMAGLDGIERKVDPTPQNLGPFDGTPPPVSRDECPGCFLPAILEEALQALEQDHEFLMRGEVFDRSLLNNFLSYKREEELYALLGAPHPLEYEMYWGL